MNIDKEIEEYQFYELTEEQEDKLKGLPQPGRSIFIEWKEREEKDVGYLFQLPNQDEDPDLLDFMVHIPNPDNSDGMDSAPPVWVHLLNLLSNTRVKHITLS